jgi:nucleoside permease NupC
MKLKERIKNTKTRWKAKSPKRNRILTNICIGVATIAGAIIAAPASLIVVPAAILTYAEITVFVAGAVGFKSKLTFIKPKSDDTTNEE